MTVRIGIDLGGSKIEAIALDGIGQEQCRFRVETPRGDYDGTVAAVVDLVARLEAAAAARGTVGIGIPGTVSPATGLVKNANSTWLNGRPFDRDLALALGRPVRVANDANCFAVSEAIDGAAAGAAVVFGVILGTGVGGGIAIGGRPVIGANAIAGEWGHNPLPWPREAERPGPACFCGRNGCLETFLSGPGLSADFRRESGRRCGADAIAALAAAGDPGALDALERYTDRLARGLAHVVNIVDPEVVVLGGGLSAITSLYERVPALWSAYVFSDRIATRIVPPRHGAASGVRGAAWLWPASDDD